MEQIPSCGLRDFYVTGELARGNAFLVRGNEVHSDEPEPLHKGQVAVLEDSAHSAREISFAVIAAESAVTAFNAMMPTAIRANYVLLLAYAPARFNDCISANFIVGEVGRKGDKRIKLREIYHTKNAFVTVCKSNKCKYHVIVKYTYKVC